MAHDNKSYLIVQVSSAPNVVFNEVEQDSTESWRKSTDGTKAIISWEGSAPAFVVGLSNTEGTYNHDQMVSVSIGAGWLDKKTSF